MKAHLIFSLFSLIFTHVYSWKFFHNGRVTGGNLLVPRRRELTDDLRNFTRWFTQNLDHFDGNTNTWQQRYFVNDEFFDQEKRNVAFLQIGGEGEASDIWMTEGAWTDYAKKNNAILFQLEHRFYGKSHPTKDLSIENLKYLTSEQALADLAFFVNAMNEEYNLDPEVKWIAFGGSYPGSLAAWVRMKYPHLIHGSVSSSGPLLALPNFQGIAQYNKEGGNITLDTACDIMTDKTGSEITRLAKFNSLLMAARHQTCLDFKYVNMIDEMKNVNWDALTSEGERQWTFQTCNEFGFYQTSDRKPQIFGDKFPLDFSVQQCIDIFGPKFNGTYLDFVTDKTNTIYGALDIETTNVVFVHGSVDPWHALGITSTVNQNTPAIFIKGTAHCANMYPPSDGDLPQLKAARVQIGQYIQTWLDL